MYVKVIKMQPEMERAWLKAQRLISQARSGQYTSFLQNTGSSESKSLHEKLADLYVEESKKCLKFKNFCTTSHLLKKLISKEELDFLIVNLYPGNEGFSLLMKKPNSDDYIETLRLSYEEDEFLQCVDNRELPQVIIDLLEQSKTNMFYSGCVIVELRDYRRSPPNYSTEYALLRPTNQTIINDLNALTSDSHQWTYEEKQQLESSMLLATQEPLCLDPSVAVTFVANHIQHEANCLNNNVIKKNIRKYSQSYVNRRKRFNQLPAPSNLKLHDFIKKRNSKVKVKKANKTPVDVWRINPVTLTPPSTIEIPNVPLPDKCNNTKEASLTLVEEYILEAERKEGKKYYTKLSVYKQTLDNVYIGELYVDRDYTDGNINGATCNFKLGSKLQVMKYVNQFREIFTEEGRKAVKITHTIPGFPSKVTYTPGMRDKTIIEPHCGDPLSTKLIGSTKDISSTSPSLLNLINNTDTTKKLSPYTKLSTIKPAGQSTLINNRGKVETTKPPSYSQALSGNKSTLKVSSLIKKSVGDLDGVTEKQNLGSIGTGDIVLNQTSSPGVNIASFPQNISLQNITRVPHLQVSLTTMPQGLTVPISIAMVNPSQATSIIVSSAGIAASPNATSSITSLSKQPLAINTSTALAPTVMVSSGSLNAQSSVLTTPTNVLSLPVGGLNAQNLTSQLMAAGLKNAPQGFRSTPGGGLSLLQVSGGQQTIPLFNQVSSPVLTTTAKPIISNNNSAEVLTLTPQQHQLQLALQKQQLQQLQQQLQIQQANTNKSKTQKRSAILKPQK